MAVPFMMLSHMTKCQAWRQRCPDPNKTNASHTPPTKAVCLRHPLHHGGGGESLPPAPPSGKKCLTLIKFGAFRSQDGSKWRKLGDQPGPQSCMKGKLENLNSIHRSHVKKPQRPALESLASSDRQASPCPHRPSLIHKPQASEKKKSCFKNKL